MSATINGVEQTDPVGTWPLAAAPDDGVSLPAAVAYMVEQQIGTIDNTTGVPTLGGVIGDVGNRSLALRLDALDAMLARAVGYVAVKNITYDGSASYPAFAVSGAVAVKVIGSVRTIFTANAATTSVGTAGSAGGLIAATAGTALSAVDQLWVDTAPTKSETFPANWTAISESIVVDGATELVAGAVTLYCYWFPLTANATLAAA